MRNMFDTTIGKTWVFTGGEFAAGGFAQNQGFRNSAGLFEEVVRWDMRGDLLPARERFVFNTARAGWNIWDVIREFEMRIAFYRPAAVVYLSGKEDDALEAEQFLMGIRKLEQMVRGIDAEWISLHQTGDSLKTANEVLKLAGAVPSLVKEEDRKKWKLIPTNQVASKAGSITLSTGPMRWLFIGDSITHGALHTFGYDSVPQLWEKYLRGDWGREDDVVLNTAVSGATAKEYLERLDIRYTPYADADVVIAMFGTNDCCFPGIISVEQFKEHLYRIIGLAREHGSQLVLRVPQPQKAEAKERAEALIPFAQAVREVGSKTGVILVDHFKSFSDLEHNAPQIFEAYMSDAVHPGVRGQYEMFRELAYATDLVKDHSMVTLTYEV